MAHNERLSLTLIFILILSFRLCVALYTDTFFQPDEFFQSLEVAHRAVFGYGHLTWEWTSPAPIRSPIYPTLYMPVYVFLKLLGMDHTRLLVGDCVVRMSPVTVVHAAPRRFYFRKR